MKLRQERRKLPDALEAIILRREIMRAVIDRSTSKLRRIKADVEKASLSPEYRELLDRRLKRAFSKLGIATD